MAGRPQGVTSIIAETLVDGRYKWGVTDTMGGCGSSESEDGTFAVASLNILGTLENPVEFLAMGDPSFMADYGIIQRRAQSITLEDVAKYVEGEDGLPFLTADGHPLKDLYEEFKKYVNESVPANAEGIKPAWNYFREEVLAQDNKLADNRINLITKAMLAMSKLDAKASGSVTSKVVYQWHLLNEPDGATWQKVMMDIVRADKSNSWTYTKDADGNGARQLFLWDMMCNIVASETKTEYLRICQKSQFYPGNLGKNTGKYVAQIEKAHKQAGALVLGIQEWPGEGTDQRAEYTKQLAQKGILLAEPDQDATNTDQVDSVAVAYSKSLAEPKPQFLTGSSGIKPKDVMQACIDEEKSAFPDHELKQKDEDGLLKTTALKTTAVRVGGKITVIVLHCKEAKNLNSLRCIGRFVTKLVTTVPQPAVVCMDGNTKSKEFAMKLEGFIMELTGNSMTILPEVEDSQGKETVTTSKRRSLLHGQTYDPKKSLRTVAVLKDRIIASNKGDGGAKMVLEKCILYPDLKLKGADSDEQSRPTLPTADWPSDHAIVSAVYRLA